MQQKQKSDTSHEGDELIEKAKRLKVKIERVNEYAVSSTYS
jgi:hypothetical protein